MTNDYRRDISQSRVDDKVSSLLAAAAAPAEPGPLPGEPEALAAFRAHAQTAARSPRMLHSVTPLKVVAASALGTGLLLTGGVAAAATGSLPGAAQDTASRILSKVGVAVPGADDDSAGHAEEGGSSQDTETAGDGGRSDRDKGRSAGHAGSGADGSGKGDHVSELARNPETTGVDKGASVSGFASGGKSKAGRHGTSGDRADHARTDVSAGQKPPAEVPDTDGADAAEDTYSGGHDGASTEDKAEAGEPDGGESAGGSENSP